MCGQNQTSMKDACKSTSRCFIALFVQAFDMQRPDTRDLPIVGSAIVDHDEGAIVARERLRPVRQGRHDNARNYGPRRVRHDRCTIRSIVG